MRQVQWIAAVSAVAGLTLTVALLTIKPAAHPPRRPPVFDRGRGGAPIVIPAEYLKLSDVDEPPHSVASGQPRSRAFTAGMRAYDAGDYATAVVQLSRARNEAPLDIDTNFFLGTASLLNNDANLAASSLRMAFERGPSPYRGLAGVYLGKALLRRAEYDNCARTWLRASGLHDPHAQEADALLRRFNHLRAAAHTP
jgi:hypothetical protein